MKNSNYVIITLLVLVILGLGCYISYDKVFKKDKEENTGTNNNKTEEKSNVSKIDASKDYVYSKDKYIFPCVEKDLEKFVTIDVPYININSESMIKLNNELKQLLDARKTLSKIEESNGVCIGEVHGTNYEIYLNDNILSIVLTLFHAKMHAGGGAYSNIVYNIDINTGEFLSYHNLLQKKNMTEKSYYDKMKTILLAKLANVDAPSVPNDNEKYLMENRTLRSMENSKSLIYLNESGKLTSIVDVENFIGLTEYSPLTFVID